MDFSGVIVFLNRALHVTSHTHTHTHTHTLYYVQSLATHTKLWYLIDARGQVVGRLATMISLLLQGKTKPIYHPAGTCTAFISLP